MEGIRGRDRYPWQLPNVISQLWARESGHIRSRSSYGWTRQRFHELAVERTLRGHFGCVNRLAWNQSGEILASGSDDQSIRLWKGLDPNNEKESCYVLSTQHQGNIFGLAFLPYQNSRYIVSGAADATVQLSHIDGSSRERIENEDSDSEDSSTRAVGQATVYSGHVGRVKQVATHPQESNIFWSASEDGSVRQYDIRVPSDLQNSESSANVVLSLASGVNSGERPRLRRGLELKCLAFNPARPYEFAVGASDRYIRIYDLRRLGLHQYSSDAARAAGECPLLKFAPPHSLLGPLAMGYTGLPDDELANGRDSRVHTLSKSHPTHITYGARGTKLLATYHCDNAYSWDVTSAGVSALTAPSSDAPASVVDFQTPLVPIVPESISRSRTKSTIGADMLPPRAFEAFTKAQVAKHSGMESDALYYYTVALKLAPKEASGPIIAGMTSVLVERAWFGDNAEALRIAEHSDEKFIPRAQALQACGLSQAAYEMLQCSSHFQEAAKQNKWECSNFEYESLDDPCSESESESYSESESEPESEPKPKPKPKQKDEDEYKIMVKLGKIIRHSIKSTRDDASSYYSGQRKKRQRRWRGEEETNTTASATATDTMSEESFMTEEQEGMDGPFLKFPESMDVLSLYRLDTTLARHIKDWRSVGCPKRGIPGVWGSIPESSRMLQRFVGHSNLRTDIKEAVFLKGGMFGEEEEAFVACTSDDGRVYIYETVTGKCIGAFLADSSIVNCVCPAPHMPMIATSGIESTVKLWSRKEPLLEESVERLEDEVSTFCHGGRYDLETLIYDSQDSFMDWDEDELGVLAIRRQILALTNRADFGFFRDLGRQFDRSRQPRSYSSGDTTGDTEQLDEERTEAVGCPIL